MAKSNEEWELSKENIQPIQQGRKQKVLKNALALHPEYLIMQQKQVFEHDLRTYSGDDPLAVWYKYIKWVEQNFPKGGREGHIKQLIERCLSIMKDKKEYYDDERFVEIFLKFANIGTKPMDVYNYMFSHNIGCKSAKFFINWSWELEQFGNLKKADEVLTEGMQRRAEPFEKLKSYHGEFQIRFANKIKEMCETNNDAQHGRSAFTMLKPVKKNLAPVIRIGEAVCENRMPLILNRQSQTKNSNSTKMPFKIYNSENISSSLPVQSLSALPPVLNSENYKENERKPSKWNKVKIKSHNQYYKSDVDPGFRFHCDEEHEEIKTPKSVPKTSNILSIRNRTPSPPMALFEPPDPLKRPMYDKSKVYGGAEEFSLEEIRAAAWFEKKRKNEQEILIAEQQRKIEEQARTEEELKKMIEHLRQQVEFLHSSLGSVTQSSEFQISKINGDTHCAERLEMENCNTYQKCLREEKKAVIKEQTHERAPLRLNTASNFTLCNPIVPSSMNEIRPSNVIDILENDCFADSATCQVAANMVQELYNRTLTHSVDENDHKQNFSINFEFNKSCNIPSSHEVSEINHNMQGSFSNELKSNLPFTVYYEPTEMISLSDKHIPRADHMNNNERSLQNNLSCNNSKMPSDTSEEDIENIPPEGYVQNTDKRELTGVLEPSKTVLFIPLEEQEDLEDDSDFENDYACSSQQPTDETLIPPSNTEQFKTDKFLASTPYTFNKNSDLQSLSVQAATSDDCKLSQNLCDVKLNDISANSQHAISESDVKAIKKPTSFTGLPNVLSVIMERSSENYSKSSSSSSSSVNLTKSSHFDSSVNNHGIIRKQFQKIEICENALSTVPEIPDCNSSSVDFYDASVSSGNLNCSKNNEIQLYSASCDPFDPRVNQKLLRSVEFSVYKNLYSVNKSIKNVKTGENINIGNSRYIVENIIAEGAYAKVYEAVISYIFSGDCSGKKVALKVCKHADEWEFYICNEIQKRLALKNDFPDIKISFMNVSSAIRYSDGIVLVSEYSNMGTLLDIVNFYKKQQSSIPELIVMYLTLEILHIISKLHACNIVHGDIKPDNFLLMNSAFGSDVLDHLSECTTSLRLIDFGRAIDLDLYQKGICFTKTFSTMHFKCNEMKDNKPWVFQLDWYGVISCIHTMLFSEYMSVQKNNKWEITKKFKRYWFTSLWKPLFADLLNIPSCYQEPDVQKFISLIESHLQQNSKTFTCQLIKLSSSYSRKK